MGLKRIPLSGKFDGSSFLHCYIFEPPCKQLKMLENKLFLDSDVLPVNHAPDKAGKLSCNGCFRNVEILF